MKPPAGAATIRPARETDAIFVRTLSAEVFSRLGDYERTVAEFFESPDVEAWIAEAEGSPAGFALVELDLERFPEADLVAIAVEPSFHRRGVGRALLSRVETEITSAWGSRASIVLTVAVDNAPARALFESAGYETVPRAYGVYPRGQLSRGMRKRLSR